MSTIENADELIPEIERPQVLYEALSSRSLELILFPTEKCNFRCTYCYEDFALGKMSKSIRQGIKNLVDIRGPDLDTLQISWFGGEPLQAYDVITDISQAVCDLSYKHNFMTFMHITTNAFGLSREKLFELSRMGMTSYQITLDGSESGHNVTRKHINGSGTFEKIWSNLLIANELFLQGDLPNTSISLRLHIHPNNIEDMQVLAAKIVAELSSALFKISIFPILKMGGPNDKDMKVFLKLEAESSIEYFATLFPGFFVVKPGGEVMCYAAKGNSFAIRADGRIAKCTVALNNDINTVGKISVNGSLNLDRGRLAPWLKPLSSMKKRDLACPISQVFAQAKASQILEEVVAS